jgi:hypothetical protein
VQAGAKLFDGGWLTDIPVEVCIARDAARTDREPVGAGRIRELAARYGLPYRRGARPTDPATGGAGSARGWRA